QRRIHPVHSYFSLQLSARCAPVAGGQSRRRAPWVSNRLKSTRGRAAVVEWRWRRDHVAAMTPKPPRIRRRSTVHRGPAYACRALVPFEADERAHRHVELAQLGGAAEVGQIDDEAGGEHLRAQLAQQL